MTWPADNSSTSFIIFGATNPTDQFGHQVLKFIDSSEVATWDPFYKMGIRRTYVKGSRIPEFPMRQLKPGGCSSQGFVGMEGENRMRI